MRAGGTLQCIGAHWCTVHDSSCRARAKVLSDADIVQSANLCCGRPSSSPYAESASCMFLVSAASVNHQAFEPSGRDKDTCCTCMCSFIHVLCHKLCYSALLPNKEFDPTKAQ
jgi:hypothetical protein